MKELSYRVCRAGYTEQAWIDELQGGVHHSTESSLMHRHQLECELCSRWKQHWMPLQPITKTLPSECEPELEISIERVRMRLLDHVGKTKRQRLPMRKVWLGGVASVLLLLLTGLYSLLPSMETTNQYIERYEPSAASIMHDPQTIAYQMKAIDPIDGQTYVWVNRNSGQLLVLLEGLNGSEPSVYQTWAVQEDRYRTIGLLKQVQQQRAHLYVKADELRQVDHISLSREPSGGSEAPTSKQLIIVPGPFQ